MRQKGDRWGDSCSCDFSLLLQQGETDETDEADASGKSFNYDDPNFPDEVTI